MSRPNFRGSRAVEGYRSVDDFGRNPAKVIVNYLKSANMLMPRKAPQMYKAPVVGTAKAMSKSYEAGSKTIQGRADQI